MPADTVPTPRSRRTGALSRHTAQKAIAALPASAIAYKYQVLDALCIAKDRLGLKDGSIAVLRALVSFHPEETLRAGEALIVHPSNRLLQARANGMPEATLRRHLGALVAAGILLRRDSPNGKRYVREGGEGRETYGFDLSLLIARAGEFEALREAVEADAREHRRLLDLVTIHRRELREIVTEAVAAGLPGDWTVTAAALQDLCARRADRMPAGALGDLVAALRALAASVDAQLAPPQQARSPNIIGNAAQNARHLSESNPQPKDLEPRFQEERGPRPPSDLQRQGEGIGGSEELTSEPHVDTSPGRGGGRPSQSLGTDALEPQPDRLRRPLPVRLVVETFPAIRDYGRRGAVDSADELVGAAEIARSALGISPSAFAEARAAMGSFEAAVAVAFILEHHETIRSPGGYLRSLTDRAGEGAFSAWAIVLSTAKRRASGLRPLGRAHSGPAP